MISRASRSLLKGRIARGFCSQRNSATDGPSLTGREFTDREIYRIPFPEQMSRNLKIVGWGGLFGLGFASTLAISFSPLLGFPLVMVGSYFLYKQYYGIVAQAESAITKIILEPNMQEVTCTYGVIEPQIFRANVGEIQTVAMESQPGSKGEVLISTFASRSRLYFVTPPPEHEKMFINNRSLLIDVLNGRQDEVRQYRFTGR